MGANQGACPDSGSGAPERVTVKLKPGEEQGLESPGQARAGARSRAARKEENQPQKTKRGGVRVGKRAPDHRHGHTGPLPGTQSRAFVGSWSWGTEDNNGQRQGNALDSWSSLHPAQATVLCRGKAGPNQESLPASGQ